MLKIIDLGATVPQTDEPRVTLLTKQTFTKLASNEISQYWDNLEKDSNNSYLWVIAMTAGEYYGCNNNGDYFNEQDLKDWHHTFTSNANIFLHHNNKDPKLAVGKPLFSFYNEPMHRVEVILSLDKSNAKNRDVVFRIKRNEPIGVSMGCSVTHDICSICGNKASKRSEYCDHLRYNMKAVLSDGRKVYALNPPPLKFFDLSVVNRPADPVAWDLAKVASEGVYAPNSPTSEKTSAELGEEYEYRLAKLAAVTKLGDMIKKLDGDIAALKDGDGADNDNSEFIPLLQLRDKAPREFDYPCAKLEDLNELNLKPGGYLKIVFSLGAPPSLGELIPTILRRFTEDPITPDMVQDVFSALPSAIEKLKEDPDQIDEEARKLVEEADDKNFLGATKGDGEKEEEEGTRKDQVRKIMTVFGPVVRQRIVLIRGVTEPAKADLEKTASVVYDRIPTQNTRKDEFSSILPVRQLHTLYEEMSAKGPGNMTKYEVEDGDGNKFYTTRQLARREYAANDFAQKITSIIPGAAAAAASVGAMLSNRSVLEKSLAVPLLLLGAKYFLEGGKVPTIQSNEGVEIPATATFYEAAKSFNKQASALSNSNFKQHMASILGMAVPTALGLDYVANKYVMNRNDPYYDMRPQPIHRRVGKFVVENPFTAVGLGGIGSAAGSTYLSNLLKARRLAKK